MKMGQFLPFTETTKRRPTPEKFEHLRKWTVPVEKNIYLTSVEEITNINQQLEITARLFISNIVQRTISQMVAAFGDGFVTLQATEDGRLLVQTDREAKVITSAAINFTGTGDHTIVAGQAGKKIKITSLVMTVGGETNITLKHNATAITGPMDFGGTNEPRGVVDTHGYLPYEIPTGEAFIINSSIDVQVSGYVSGYIE